VTQRLMSGQEADVPTTKLALADKLKKYGEEITTFEKETSDAEDKVKSIQDWETGTKQKELREIADKAAATRAEAAKVAEATEAMVSSAQGNFAETRADAAKLRALKRKVEKDWLAEKPKLVAQDNELKGMCGELEERLKVATEPIPPPEGEIVSVSRDGKTATINIGRDRDVRPKDEFYVYPKTKGGFAKGNEKALARVNEVGEYSSVVSLFDAKPMNPVVHGDLIEPPVQDTAAKTVAIAGVFSPAGFTEDELKAILVKKGWTYKPKLDASTNFIIVGETEVPKGASPEEQARAAEAEKLLAKARELGTYPLTVEDFLVMAGEMRRSSISQPLPEPARGGRAMRTR